MGDEKLRMKIVVVGDGTVGKSALLTVFLKLLEGEEVPEDFFEMYIPTIFENYCATINLNGKNVSRFFGFNLEKFRKITLEKISHLGTIFFYFIRFYFYSFFF